MNPDDLQTAWQAQPPPDARATDPDRLLKIIQAANRLDRTIFWRDVREIGVALVLIPVWIILGVKESLPWSWYLMEPVLVWVAGFMVWYRLRGRRLAPRPDDPVRQQFAAALAQVDHQIWLLRNVSWWALLPFGLASSAFIVQKSWEERASGWLWLVAPSLVVALSAATLGLVAWVNLYAVRTELLPRRREVSTLLASLTDELPEPA